MLAFPTLQLAAVDHTRHAPLPAGVKPGYLGRHMHAYAYGVSNSERANERMCSVFERRVMNEREPKEKARKREKMKEREREKKNTETKTERETDKKEEKNKQEKTGARTHALDTTL